MIYSLLFISIGVIAILLKRIYELNKMLSNRIDIIGQLKAKHKHDIEQLKAKYKEQLNRKTKQSTPFDNLVNQALASGSNTISLRGNSTIKAPKKLKY